jgi:methyl coenzyme M reductase gamma subunit
MPDLQEGDQETQDGVHVKMKGMYHHEQSVTLPRNTLAFLVLDTLILTRDQNNLSYGKTQVGGIAYTRRILTPYLFSFDSINKLRKYAKVFLTGRERKTK